MNILVPLLNVFLENIKKKIANELPTARKLHLFSAHRLSLVEILSGLESWDILNGTITPCSYILLEMVQEFATGYYKIHVSLLPIKLKTK